MKYKKLPSAVENVKRFFSNTSDDVVSLQDAFLAWGRDLEKVKENRAWLSNIMTHLKYHNLITPVYSYVGKYRTLDKLQLTLEGKTALGRVGNNHNVTDGAMQIANNAPTSFNDVAKIVAKWEKENPEFMVTFDIKLKGDNVGISGT